MKNQRQIRQGDVLINPIATIPEAAKPLLARKRLILAEGEATGHAHAIKASRKVTAYQNAGAQAMYLEVHEPVQIEHEEHAALTLEPGCYEVRRQVEIWLDEIRQVRD